MQNFTSNDLLLYVLKELDNEKAQQIDNEFQSNSQLLTEVNNLSQSIQEIKNISFSPSAKLMDKVFEKLQIENDVVII